MSVVSRLDVANKITSFLSWRNVYAKPDLYFLIYSGRYDRKKAVSKEYIPLELSSGHQLRPRQSSKVDGLFSAENPLSKNLSRKIFAKVSNNVISYLLP